MVKRLFAVVFIFLCTSVAWLILGGTLVARSSSSSDRLRSRVPSVWGAPHVQVAPHAEYKLPVRSTETVKEDGKLKVIERTRFDSHTLRPSASDIHVDLKNEYRRKGLLWYSTFKVAFRGDYTFRNPEPDQQKIRVYLPLPAAQAVYDDLQFVVDGRSVSPVTEKEGAYVPLDLLPKGNVNVRVSYRSQGLESWRYSFGQEVNAVENFHMGMTTNFRDIDFPDNTLAPSEKREIADGWRLDWTYKNLLSGYSIAMTMPEKLQPGPLASEISFF